MTKATTKPTTRKTGATPRVTPKIETRRDRQAKTKADDLFKASREKFSDGFDLQELKEKHARKYSKNEVIMFSALSGLSVAVIFLGAIVGTLLR